MGFWFGFGLGIAVLVTAAGANDYSEKDLGEVQASVVERYSAVQQNAAQLERSARALGQPGSKIVNEDNKKCYLWGWDGNTRQSPFGASVDASLCLEAIYDPLKPIKNARTEVNAVGSVNVKISNNQLEVIRARATATAPVVGDPSVNASVEAFGFVVWDDAVSAPNLRWSKSFDLMSFDRSVPYRFMVGPFPGTARIGVRGQARATLSARGGVVNAQADVIPTVETFGYAFGGVEAGPISGGIEGSATVLVNTTHVNGSAGLLITPVPFKVEFLGEVSGNNSLRALEGRIDLVARSKVEIPRLGKEFIYPLFSYPGIERQSVIFNDKFGPYPL